MIERYNDMQFDYLMGLDKNSPKPKRKFPYWIIAAVIMALAIIYFSSCNTEKHIVKVKEGVDSSYVKELSDSVRLLKTTNERLEQTINEMQYSGVTFDTGCDSIINAFKKTLKEKMDPKVADSLIAIITGLQSKIRYYADGSYEASGLLASFKTENKNQQQTIFELHQNLDSLSDSFNKAQSEIKKLKEAKVEDKKLKTEFPLWLFIFLAIGGAFFWEQTRGYVVTFISKIFKR